MTRKKSGITAARQLLGCKLPPEVIEEIAALGSENERSKSWVGRKLLERGLSAYRRDGRFEDEPRPRAEGGESQ